MNNDNFKNKRQVFSEIEHKGWRTHSKKSVASSYLTFYILLFFNVSAPYTASAQDPHENFVLYNLHDADGSGVVGDTADEWGLDIGEDIFMSENGSNIIGTIHDGNLKRAFIWYVDNGVINLIKLADTDKSGVIGDTADEWGIGASSSEDISADGNAVVGHVYDATSVKRGFYWDAQRGMLNIADDDNSGTVGDVADEWAVGTIERILISSDGKVVGGKVNDVNGIKRVFRWTPETRLVDLGDGITWATGDTELVFISADGSVFSGFVKDGTTNRVFRWDQASGMINLSDVDGDGIIGSVANEWAVGASVPAAMSTDGSVIGGAARDSGNISRPWIWRADLGMVNIADKNGDQQYDPLEGEWAGSHGRVIAMSDDGTVVTGYAVPTGGASYEAFRWTEASGMVNIDAGWAVGHSLTIMISPDGSVIVGRAKADADGTVYYPFRWDQTNGMVNLADRDGNGIVDGTSTEWATGTTVPKFMSTDGNIIVGYANDGVSNNAFIWTSNTGMNRFGDLDGSGVRGDTDEEWADYLEIQSMSSDGLVIAGRALEKTTQKYRAFVYREIIPDPVEDPVDNNNGGGANGVLLDIENTQTILIQNSYNQMAVVGLSEANVNSLINNATRIADETNFSFQKLHLSIIDNPTNVNAQTSMPWDISVSAGRYGVGSNSKNDVSGLTAITQLPNGIKLGGIYGYTILENELSASELTGDLYTLGVFLEKEIPELSNFAFKISYAKSSSKNLVINRIANLTGTENALGKTNFKTNYYSVGVKKTWPANTWDTTTIFELSRTRSKRDGYVEQAAAFPISYGDMLHSTTIGRIGVEAKAPINTVADVRLSFGLDWDVKRSTEVITGTSDILGMETFSVYAQPIANKIRTNVGASLSQKLDNGTLVDVNLSIQENTFSKGHSYGVSVGYSWNF